MQLKKKHIRNQKYESQYYIIYLNLYYIVIISNHNHALKNFKICDHDYFTPRCYNATIKESKPFLHC